MTTFRAGYNLTEVILAMAVMSVSVPLILGLVVAGGESSRRAEQETRAVMTARSVFEELRHAQEGNSGIIAADEIPWGAGPVNAGVAGIGGGRSIPGPLSGSENSNDDGWLLLELDADGALIDLADEMDYEEGWRGLNERVTSIAAVRGFSQEVEDAEISEGQPLRVFRIEVRIETPARAAARSRERTVFIKSDSLR